MKTNHVIDFWNLKPLRSSRGSRVIIENITQSLVLGVVDETLQFVDNHRGHSWIKGEPNKQGYFTLIHPASGKALTTTSDGFLAMEGNRKPRH